MCVSFIGKKAEEERILSLALEEVSNHTAENPVSKNGDRLNCLFLVLQAKSAAFFP